MSEAEDQMIEVVKQCPFCGAAGMVRCSDKKYVLYRSGKGPNIQYLFPELSAQQRETLKTGICAKCWDKI